MIIYHFSSLMKRFRIVLPGVPRPVVFRPHFSMGLAFSVRGFELPTGKNRLLGARHIHFEVLFHG